MLSQKKELPLIQVRQQQWMNIHPQEHSGAEAVHWICIILQTLRTKICRNSISSASPHTKIGSVCLERGLPESLQGAEAKVHEGSRIGIPTV